jgi:hypothetical protein
MHEWFDPLTGRVLSRPGTIYRAEAAFDGLSTFPAAPGFPPVIRDDDEDDDRDPEDEPDDDDPEGDHPDSENPYDYESMRRRGIVKTRGRMAKDIK